MKRIKRLHQSGYSLVSTLSFHGSVALEMQVALKVRTPSCKVKNPRTLELDILRTDEAVTVEWIAGWTPAYYAI
jgi:hypothetical protein